MIILGKQKAVLVSIWWCYVMMGRYWLLVLGGTGSVKLGIAWCQVELGQCKAFMPVYIEKSGDLVGSNHSETDKRTNERTNKERQSLSPNVPWKAESGLGVGDACFLDALASLDFKLSVSESVMFFGQRIYGSFRVIEEQSFLYKKSSNFRKKLPL